MKTCMFLCFHVKFKHENTKQACFHVNVSFSAYSYPPLQYNGKRSISLPAPSHTVRSAGYLN